MDEYGEWIALGTFGPLHDDRGRASQASMISVRAWEALRLREQVEWALVVIANGDAFERYGVRDRVGFGGFEAAESDWRILSHTHPLGLPPSIEDIQFLLGIRAGIRLRIARLEGPTIEMWRDGSVVVTNADASAIIRETRMRIIGPRGFRTGSAVGAERLWAEIQPECDKLGIRWAQDLETNM